MTRRLKPICVLSDSLWNHRLFESPPSYPEPRRQVAAEWVDAGVRRNRCMPSTGDTAADRALPLLKKLYEAERQTLLQIQSGAPWFAANPAVVLWNQVHLLIERLQGAPGPREARTLDRLMPALIRQGALPSPPSADTRISELVLMLHAAELRLQEGIVRTVSDLHRRHLRRTYRILNDALSYNATSDTLRIEPVLAWIKTLLPRSTDPSTAYADVGCSFSTGAQNTLVASQCLRPDCVRTIHGTDILPPEAPLRRDMLRRHHVSLYQADPVHHPLPRIYSVILLANVHRHLTRDDQKRLFAHLGSSLAEGGFLFINWRFDAHQSPCLCLQRQHDRLEITAEHNCV